MFDHPIQTSQLAALWASIAVSLWVLLRAGDAIESGVYSLRQLRSGDSGELLTPGSTSGIRAAWRSVSGPLLTSAAGAAVMLAALWAVYPGPWVIDFGGMIRLLGAMCVAVGGAAYLVAMGCYATQVVWAVATAAVGGAPSGRRVPLDPVSAAPCLVANARLRWQQFRADRAMRRIAPGAFLHTSDPVSELASRWVIPAGESAQPMFEFLDGNPMLHRMWRLDGPDDESTLSVDWDYTAAMPGWLRRIAQHSAPTTTGSVR